MPSSIASFADEKQALSPTPASPHSSTQRWYHWYNELDTPAERKLLAKIDVLILVPLCAGYFVKILDSSAVSTAYVSGMKTALNMEGADLTYAGSVYTGGYVGLQVPFTILSTVFPTRWWIPFCDLMWAILTIATCKVKTVESLYAVRFFSGAFGSLYFPTAQYILGSWYRPGEITRRAAIFFVASEVGGMASGYIESALYVTMNGVGGFESWQWLFIISGIVTIPVAIIAFVLLPGVPERCTSWFLTPEEVELAKERLVKEGRRPLEKLEWSTFTGLARTWHWPVLVIFAIFFSNGDGVSSYSGLPLFLQAIGQSVVNINTITTVIPAVTIVSAFIIAIYADSHPNSAVTLITIVGFLNVFAAIVLAVWNGVPQGLKYFAFFLSGTADGVAAVVYSWANEICSSLSAEQRAIVLSSMNAVGNAFAVWLPILVWRTDDAPRYLKGYTFQACDSSAMIAMAFVVADFWKREQLRALVVVGEK